MRPSRSITGTMDSKEACNDIIAWQGSGDKRRASFTGAEIRKRKHNHLPFYKSAHASSSSGESHSQDRVDSDASMVW